MLKQNACVLKIQSNGHLAKVFGLNERRFIEFCSWRVEGGITQRTGKIYNDVKNIGGDFLNEQQE